MCALTAAGPLLVNMTLPVTGNVVHISIHYDIHIIRD